jgi:hypothetical protein
LTVLNKPFNTAVTTNKRIIMFKRNVGSKERIVRVISGGLMIVCGLVGLQATPLGIGIAGVGAIGLITGLVRYCPACAMAGRKSTDNC